MYTVKCNCLAVSPSSIENVAQNYFDSGFVMIVIGCFCTMKQKLKGRKLANSFIILSKKSTSHWLVDLSGKTYGYMCSVVVSATFTFAANTPCYQVCSTNCEHIVGIKYKRNYSHLGMKNQPSESLVECEYAIWWWVILIKLSLHASILHHYTTRHLFSFSSPVHHPFFLFCFFFLVCNKIIVNLMSAGWNQTHK